MISGGTKKTSDSGVQNLLSIKGVGPKTLACLREYGIEQTADLLRVVPRGYRDLGEVTPINKLAPGILATVRGRVISSTKPWRGRGVLFANLKIEDATGNLTAIFFGAPAKGVAKLFFRGREVILSGEVQIVKGHLAMQHPDYYFPEDESCRIERIQPVYPFIQGIGKKQLRSFTRRALELLSDKLTDGLPRNRSDIPEFPDLKTSLFSIHAPDGSDSAADLNRSAAPAQQRMIFDELFFLQLALLIRRRSQESVASFPVRSMTALDAKIREQLGFNLTPDQEKVLSDIRADLAGRIPMHRLLQGDVGSGKTVVALLACAMIVENGYQAAIMAPTEILAAQHFRKLEPICRKAGIRMRILTAATPKGDAEEILSEALGGELDIIIGTHALITNRVHFRQLALVVIDEQHRFGVLQRAKLSDKQVVPHVLVMSATPVPRTLALTVYGDLDLSIIRNAPAGRKKVETIRVATEQDAINIVREKLKNGDRAFFVYPLVEESEKSDSSAAVPMFKDLSKKYFSDYRVGLVHGKLSEEEKNKAMRDFSEGGTDILVATTIIEVGVDVPEAGVIVINNAERFGLPQLHQLRGRVGRSDREACCVLVASESAGETAKMRLETMIRTTDGFEIAEKDLAIRGPGDILGTRQHGLPILRWARLARDIVFLEKARTAALSLLRDDPFLKQHPETARVLESRFKRELRMSGIG